jgi:energy-converting hydrogenase Eha subunit B
MLRTQQDLQRLYPFNQPIILTRQAIEDFIDNRMFVNLSYFGESPGSKGPTIGRNLKITTLGNLRAGGNRIYFRGFQITGPSISAGFLIGEWRLFIMDRSVTASWTGGTWGINPPGYLNTDKVLTNLYNLANN